MSSSQKKGNYRRHRTKGLLKGFHRTHAPGSGPELSEAAVPAGRCQVRRITYGRHDVVEEQIVEWRSLKSPIADDRVTWLQITGTPDLTVLTYLSQVLGIHALALEDISNTHQRCKVEDYGDHLFIVSRLPSYAEQGALMTEQVGLFLGARFVVTIYEGQNFWDTVRDRIIRSRSRLPEMPADYLAYVILDMVTDHYFPVIEEIGNRLNAVDAQIETGVSYEQRSEIRDLRSDLLLLRRTIWPQRDALATLMRDDCKLISPATRTYLRDCYDHTVQIIDVTETYRELCADLRDFHLAEVSFRSNEVMKTLTIIATLFMPLSFMAGFYGMNFQHMPELAWQYSYPTLIACMLVISSSLLYWFSRKGWLR